MYKTNELHGRRGSYVAATEKHAIERIFEEPLTNNKKFKSDSRNLNPTPNLYGRRSESVTTTLEKQVPKRITFKDEPHYTKTIAPANFVISVKSDTALVRNPKLMRFQSKNNLNNIYTANSSPFNKESANQQKKLQQISNDKLREEIKVKDNELANLRVIIKNIGDKLKPLNYSINTLSSFINEYQELHQMQITMAKENKILKDKCIEAEQQLKFFESMEKNKHPLRKKKEKLNTTRKNSFEKIESILSNLNVNLYQLNDVICSGEFLESVLSVKIEKEAEEIELQKNERRAAVSHYSDKMYKEGSDADGSKQRIEIDEQTLDMLKKSADEQVESIKSGFGEMRDCWKLYYSFMRSFLEIYAGEDESVDYRDC